MSEKCQMSNSKWIKDDESQLCYIFIYIYIYKSYKLIIGIKN